MSNNPYQHLPPSAFWRSAVVDSSPFDLQSVFTPKFPITQATRIATAGSCFAQHISQRLRQHGYTVLDEEPAPPGLPTGLRKKHGYATYSARYGNIYSVEQLLQLAKETAGLSPSLHYIWERDGRFVDALRPSIDPEGYATREEVIHKRQAHLSRVRKVFESMDLFIFTLGLTEHWVHTPSSTIYPSPPGVRGGTFDSDVYRLHNSSFLDVVRAIREFRSIVRAMRKGRSFKMLLTVSPVPLTATASNAHVLTSNAYSKSTLRAAAGYLTSTYRNVDYFPAYELVTNPRLHSIAFEANLRSVRPETVSIVMKHFFTAVGGELNQQQKRPGKQSLENTKESEAFCDEALLEVFAP